MEFVFDDPRWNVFTTDVGGGLGRHSHLVKDLWDRGLSQWTAQEAEAIIVSHGGWVGPCLTFDEFANDAQSRHLGLFVTAEHSDDPLLDVRPPWQLSETPASAREPAPKLDEHGTKIQREIITTRRWATR